MLLDRKQRKVSPADFRKVILMSQALVKLQRKGQMVIPRSLREEAGVAEGTLMKVAVIEGGQFLVTPQLTIARSAITQQGSRGRKHALRELAQVVAELRQEAKEKGLHKMGKGEIDAAVSAARRDLKKSTNRPAK
jgi:AbrB family looped-hinge helix DNA binding protein